ncbi:MAG: WecB/TagA/CpsF family glycosyltransferase [Candidatus Eremiobacteraeota bacterium]|nr:WecB/TagA/CpsF family glycosyltransferase [Candidatus Eremiobacteraeota bacterium]
MSLAILGCKLDDIDAATATAKILAWARDGAAAQVVTLGTEMVVYAQHDPAFRGIINNAALALCDTIGLLLVARMRGSALRERVTGVELADHLCASAAASNLGVYLLGGAPGIAERAAAALCERHPALDVRGTHDGYFGRDAEAGIVAQIRDSGARVLFVGLGSPRQEVWLAEHLSATGCGVGIGVGGSFDVMSGNVQRAPKLWRTLGLEWLHRLVREPHRWRRQLALPYFVWLVVLDGARQALAGKKSHSW